MRSRSGTGLIVLLALALAACDGTREPVLRVDAGGDAPPDELRPYVVSTSPASGSADVPPDEWIDVTFSEPIAEGGGVTVTADGTAVALEPLHWDDARRVLSIEPVEALPSRARVQVRIADDFEDRAGNPLREPVLVVFEVGDAAAPRVIASEPVVGDTGVSARLGAIEVRFDEPMDARAGTARLEGPGTARVIEQRWAEGALLRVTIEGLSHESAYRLVLDGFTDAAGRALDTTAYLDEGAITFTTGPDADAPRVVDASPAEGQVNVATLTREIVVAFDEPMDVTRRAARLDVPGTEMWLTGTWSEDSRTITFGAAGHLAPSGAHALDLTALRDVAGNALDPVTYLEDGALDFATGADGRPPTVVSSTPVEGARNVRASIEEIVVRFDRAMDRDATATVRVDDGVAPIDVPARWNLAGTELHLDVRARLYAERAHRVDLRAQRDLFGTALDVAGVYLGGDGELDFTTANGSGESCTDALSIASATPVAGGGHEWRLAARAVTSREGEGAGAQCATRPDWISPDAVVRVVKTTPAASQGGTYLHVTATSAASRLVVLEVRSSCAPSREPIDPARLDCPGERATWESWLDVGPGEYFVWVATAAAGTLAAFEGATIRVDEVAAVPEGESCADPYDASSVIHTVGAGGEHVYTIPASAGRASDRTVVAYDGAGTMQCDPERVQGGDVVIALPKASSTSVLSAVVQGEVDVELLDRCDARATGARSLACAAADISGRLRAELTTRGPAGTHYAWMAATKPYLGMAGATLRVREIEPQAGDDCAHAIRIAPSGTTTISATRPERLDVPGCFPTTGGITWYRFTAAEAATVIDASGPGAIAVVAPGALEARSCTTDTSGPALGAFATPGSDVCIAISSSAGIGSLTLTPVPYDGVMGRVTPLGIAPPARATGGLESMESEVWIAVTPTTIHAAVQWPARILSVPRAGHVRADSHELEEFELGYSGVAVGEALFSLDDAGFYDLGLGTIVGPADQTRLYRVVTPGGTFTTREPFDWDGPARLGSQVYRSVAYDGAELWLLVDSPAALGGGGSAGPITLYRASPSAPGVVRVAGVLSTMQRAIATAVDATYVYLLGRVGGAGGVYRVRRDALGDDPIPELVAPANVPETMPRGSIELDSVVAAQTLYFRDAQGDLRVVTGLGTSTPIDLGVLSPLGDADDHQLTYDALGRSIFLFESETDARGNFVRLD
ncbi:Ig-like domain-containing protein [Sandaracinus amylolyticus]|uniref:Hemagglutinin protein n=1 Tax=Sandaracinus amylolyticus TaxID=927083 RepID=A0A0F6W8N9_9BACT|nr:Ig-like domain-containing protein [Sandaracinus amylolyticus]AKF10152.1 hemagglutinin protein [Sandaracinus amylolyticus]